MVDKGGPRTGRERIKTLAQAALNADLTVEQVDQVLNNLVSSLAALDKSIEGLDGSLETFNSSLTYLNDTLNRMEGIVDRVERIVEIGEAAVAPLSATESAVRQVVKTIRDRTHL
ncbi:MAG: ATPase [Mycobacteriaceae bacterium]|nr:ATPase [Mycobacteriaceae bacterium]